SWRFMFWVNVPFCVAGLVLAARYLPGDRAAAAGRPKLDVLGFALLAPGIAALILGLSNAGTAAGFGHPDVIIPLAIGVALVLAFSLYALRRSEPLADIRLLARRPVASSSAVLFFSGFALYGAMLLLPLFYQEARAATPLPFCFADPKTSSWLLGFWLLLRGIGLGTVTIPVMAVAYLGLGKAE